MSDVEKNDLAEQFLGWVRARHMEGCVIETTPGGARIVHELATAHVNVYELDEMDIVDLRIEQAADGETVFFLHFELTDLMRAKDIYYEMEEALEGIINRKVDHVLLCCTCGITTTYFASKMNETAVSLGLDYDFEALPIEEAVERGNDYVAVLLAPQVGHRVAELQVKLPDAVVIELPGHIFGAYDAAQALRLVADAISERADMEADDRDSLRYARELSLGKRILVISHVVREQRESTLSYRIFDHGKITLSGRISRPKLGPGAVLDLVEKVTQSGWNTIDFDAIGLAVSERVVDGTVYMGDGDELDQDYEDVARILSERWGTSVFLHNTGLAAAACCYLTQGSYESVGFHAQPLGNPVPTQGFVVDGRPYVGYGGMVGQMGYFLKGIYLHRNPEASSWHYEGVRELVVRYLTAIACTIAPEAIYVWCDLMPDLEDIERELRQILPKDAMPDLVAVDDYEGYVLTGELGLCLDELIQLEED